MAWETSSNYFSGQGVVLLAPIVGGVTGGFVELGNVSDAKIAIATQVKEHKEAQTGARSIDYRLTTEVKATLSMTLESYNPTNLATVLRGESASRAAGTAVSVPATVHMGKIIALPHVSVSNVVVTVGGTPLTAVTDYVLNAAAGSLKFSPTITGVTNGAAATVSYSYGAQSVIESLNHAASEVAIRFEGLNTADTNKSVIVDVWRFMTDPLKELALISDDIGKFMLDGSVLVDMSRPAGESRYFRMIQAS